MCHRLLIALFAFVVLAGRVAPELSAAEAKRPNILLIYTDDHSYRTVSCYPEAYKWVNTPNIDRLAKQGVRFTHAYIGTWCMPSRATLLTGHHPYGVESMRMEGTYPGSEYDPEKCRFWPSDFRKHPCRCASSQISALHYVKKSRRGCPGRISTSRCCSVSL